MHRFWNPRLGGRGAPESAAEQSHGLTSGRWCARTNRGRSRGHQHRRASDLRPQQHHVVGVAALHHGFKQRQQFIQLRQLLFVNEDVGILHFNAHLVGVGDEVGRDVAAVELHAFDHLEFGLERLGFLNRDDALVADLLHGVGEELADFGVAVGGDGSNLGDFLVRGDLLGVLDEVGDHGFHRQDRCRA